MHARVLSRTQWREIEEDILPEVVDPTREAIDVGANVGQYAVALATLARRVYAFEPDEELSSFLARAAPANLEVFQEALSDHEGPRSLRVPTHAGVPSVSLAAIDDADGRPDEPYELRTIHASTLDKLADRDIGFVKIDVEGHELAVLTGGRTLIEKQRPVVLVEVEERHTRGSLAAMKDFFGSFEYVGFFLYDGRTYALDDFTLDMQSTEEIERQVDRRQMRYVNNFFFAPSRSLAEELRRKIDAHLLSRP